METNFDLDWTKRVKAHEPQDAPNVLIGVCPECHEGVYQLQDFLVIEGGLHAHTACEDHYFRS